MIITSRHATLLLIAVSGAANAADICCQPKDCTGGVSTGETYITVPGEWVTYYSPPGPTPVPPVPPPTVNTGGKADVQIAARKAQKDCSEKAGYIPLGGGCLDIREYTVVLDPAGPQVTTENQLVEVGNLINTYRIRAIAKYHYYIDLNEPAPAKSTTGDPSISDQEGCRRDGL